MADQIHLEVITPERRVLAEEVNAVAVPGLDGEIGILPGHTPLISQLRTGALAYTQGGETHRLHVSGGFVEVNADRVTVLADLAEQPSEIDTARARTEREQAEKTLVNFTGSEEELEAELNRLEQANVRLQLGAGS